MLAVIGLAEYAALVWAFWASIVPIDWHIEHAAPRVVATPAFVAAIFLPLLVAHHHRSGSGDEDATRSATRAAAPPSGRQAQAGTRWAQRPPGTEPDSRAQVGYQDDPVEPAFVFRPDRLGVLQDLPRPRSGVSVP